MRPASLPLIAIVGMLLGQAASAQYAVDPRLSEAIRLEVDRQLRTEKTGESSQPTDEEGTVAGVNIDLIRRLVSEELARRQEPRSSTASVDAAPAPQSQRELAGEDWYYIQSDGEAPSQGEVSLRERYYRSPAAPARRALAGIAGAVTADNPVRPSNDALELIASSSGTEATITLSSKEKNRGDPDGPRIDTTAWSLTATAPLNKETEEATFASLAGLANGFNLGTTWKFSSVPRHLSSESSAWTRVISIEANAGYDDFSYFTSLTEKEKDREMRWSLGASFGTSSPERNYYFGAGFDVQHAYEGQTPRIVCPLSTEATFDCVQGAFGPPSSGYQRSAYVEARGSVMARPVSLRISHEFEDDVTSADLPIYLLRDKDKFTGGLRFGWLSEDSEFLVGVFVGKEFGIP